MPDLVMTACSAARFSGRTRSRIGGRPGRTLRQLHGECLRVLLVDDGFDDQGPGVVGGLVELGRAPLGAGRQQMDRSEQIDFRVAVIDLPKRRLGGLGIGRYRGACRHDRKADRGQAAAKFIPDAHSISLRVASM
jgi:hypothetical protein